MHYHINDIVIKSENTAKSVKQKNKFIVDYLCRMDSCNKVLDYGCGKCRYMSLLLPKSKELYLLDSDIQLERLQIIDDQHISVKDYAKQFSNVFILQNNEINKLQKHFDFILCTNVLSAIPYLSERRKVLTNIMNLLTENGTALISVQYRNSYFKTYAQNQNNRPFGDGWIIKKDLNYTFYGMIYPSNLFNLCDTTGLSVISQTNNDGSSFVLVRKKQND